MTGVWRAGIAILEKWRSKRGESLTEVLAAVVVGGLSILLMAMAISTASNMVRQSNDSMRTYYAANNDLADPGSSADFEGTVTVKEVNEMSANPAWEKNFNVEYSVSMQNEIASYQTAEPVTEP